MLDIGSEVYSLNETTKAEIYAMYNSYGKGGALRHYLAYYQGEPAATVTAHLNGEAVGLYNGATLAKFQKKGLCSALIQHALRDAKLQGCQLAVAQLMAPGMAKGLIEKMGFKTYCKFFPFAKI